LTAIRLARSGGSSMANIDGIDRRLDKLENGTRHPPLIVWEGHECSAKPKPGQEVIRIAWGKPETSTHEDDRE